MALNIWELSAAQRGANARIVGLGWAAVSLVWKPSKVSGLYMGSAFSCMVFTVVLL